MRQRGVELPVPRPAGHHSSSPKRPLDEIAEKLGVTLGQLQAHMEKEDNSPKPALFVRSASSNQWGRHKPLYDVREVVAWWKKKQAKQ